MSIETHEAPFPAQTNWLQDEEWADRGAVLPPGVVNRLASSNRAIFALRTIITMLIEDSRGKADHDDSGAEFSGLAAFEVEALQIAMQELVQQAEANLTAVRENHHNCASKSP